MRYLLMVHGAAHTGEASARLVHAGRSAAQIEAAVTFAAALEDELAASSELEWSEVLDEPGRAQQFGADGLPAAGGGSSLTRVWAVRVTDPARAYALGERIARGLTARVEVRECFAGSQRP
ncbi:acyl-coenzyme A thioesterase PaaI-like protein [Leucobacter exalbidus]|uniref:Acyl-coenzyme A thioesterase PaaI-like protein n=1 Tax=Leucobacter exalbidus TaxID=662960 RepID=A0A940PYE6_9MICO|nr:hypothetical protein [Leucobacter exalbidus]MBP1326426.1 acyl-coenzyme A thioesterase PaaI-like protein [Leucobacter exalbidus]